MIVVGRRIYYDKFTGSPITDTGERRGETVRQTTIDEDFQSYILLKGRTRDTVGVIELQYGQYAQDFAECNSYRVNPETKELEFSYPDPNVEEPQEPIYRPPLSVEVRELKQRQEATDSAVLQLLMEGMM